MNPALEPSGETRARRKATVKGVVFRLDADLLTVAPSACGISEHQIAQLIATLAELGPVFSQFGRYLGSRYDLFRPEACCTLAETGTVSLPTADELAQGHLRDFPEGTATWLQILRPEEERSDHLIHYYRWPGRPHLSLRILNPTFLALWEQDQHLLETLASPARRIWPGVPLKEVIREFRQLVETRRDLDGTGQSYHRFIEQDQEGEFLGPNRFALPQVADEFCAPGVLSVMEPPPGSRAATAHVAFHNLLHAEQGHAIRVQTARNLCLVWLRHALRGSWYPVEPDSRHLGIAADDTLCLLGGPLRTLDLESQDFLFRYLCAVAANQPDMAADVLVSHLHPARGAKELYEVRDLFRQIVPFRDGQINQAGDHELFAEHVLAQWRVIREAGYHADSDLLSLLHSFAAVARLAHELSPRRDTFKDALYEFRWTDSLAHLRNLFTFSAAARQSQDWLNLMMEIPEKMNLAAQGRGLAQSTPVPPANKSRSPAAPALLLLSHAFILIFLGWLVQTTLSQQPENTLTQTLVVLTIIGVSISMIRSLLPKR